MNIFSKFSNKAKEKSVSSNKMPEDINQYPLSSVKNADEFPLGVGDDGQPVVWDRGRSYSNHLLVVGSLGTGRTIAMRSIIKHASDFPERYVTYGVDLSRIEFMPYLKHPFNMEGVATTLDETLNLLQSIEEEMDQRAKAFEHKNIPNVKHDESYHHIIVMIEEVKDLFSLGEDPSTDKTKLKIIESIFNISNIGRVSGVSIVLTSRHQEIWNLIPGAIRLNFMSKLLTGSMSAEQIEKFDILDENVKLNSRSKGVGYYSPKGDAIEGLQLYYLPMNHTYKEQLPLITGGMAKKFIRKPMVQDKVKLSLTKEN